MSDLEAIRGRHVLYAADPSITRTDDDPAWCAVCQDPWPCDAAVLLAALDELAAQLKLDWELLHQEFEADSVEECSTSDEPCRICREHLAVL